LAAIDKHEHLERTVDRLRERFGHYAVRRGIMLSNQRLAGTSPKDDHLVFPVSYFA
jgi:DNA polymerase-4